MGALVVIARIISFAAGCYLVSRYLAPSETLMTKPQAEDKKQSRGNRGTIVLDAQNEENTAEDEYIHDYGGQVMPIVYRTPNVTSNSCNNIQDYTKNVRRLHGGGFNSTAFHALERRKPLLDKVMQALADPITHLIGVYGSDDDIKDTLLERVCRRVRRDKLLDMVLTVVVTKKPDVKKIQETIAHQLGFNFNEKSKEKRADELLHRIKNEQKILIIIRDLCKSLDLGKIGIPFGANHNGCKILLTSTSEEVLSNQMHTQKNFMV